MNTFEEFFSKEANLVNSSKRELANGLYKDPVYKLRLLCFAKGAKGIMELARLFRQLDQDGDNRLSESEFKEALKQMGLVVDSEETKTMFDYLDDNHDGFINANEFLSRLRPPLRQSRLHLIESAFNKIDHNGDGVITVEDLKHMYNVRDHPKYLSGELSEQEILAQFLQNFLAGGPKNCAAPITKEDFINYYVGVSASMDNDAYFDLVMRRAYKL